MLPTAQHCHKLERNEAEQRHASPELACLIRERRDLSEERAHEEPGVRARISKRIQRLLRKQMRLQRTTKIDKILSQFSGLKHVTGIRNNGKRNHCCSVLSAAGEVVVDQQGIADVFADFITRCMPLEAPQMPLTLLNTLLLFQNSLRMESGQS